MFRLWVCLLTAILSLFGLLLLVSWLGLFVGWFVCYLFAGFFGVWCLVFSMFDWLFMCLLGVWGAVRYFVYCLAA